MVLGPWGGGPWKRKDWCRDRKVALLRALDMLKGAAEWYGQCRYLKVLTLCGSVGFPERPLKAG